MPMKIGIRAGFLQNALCTQSPPIRKRWIRRSFLHAIIAYSLGHSVIDSPLTVPSRSRIHRVVKQNADIPNTILEHHRSLELLGDEPKRGESERPFSQASWRHGSPWLRTICSDFVCPSQGRYGATLDLRNLICY